MPTTSISWRSHSGWHSLLGSAIGHTPTAAQWNSRIEDPTVLRYVLVEVVTMRRNRVILFDVYG
jgi:hypothetical protein